MLLKEFLYFDKEEYGMSDTGRRYDPGRDVSVIKASDTRKSRLTLKMINDLRKAAETREREQAADLELVQKMYANPPQEGGMI